MSEYHKLYSEKWWKSDFVTYGPAAMKQSTTTTHVGSLVNITLLQQFKVWDLAGSRYGKDVSDWLCIVWMRLQNESETQLLWLYLLYQTIVATEIEACEDVWFQMQLRWDRGDIAVWNDRSAAIARATELQAALDNLSDRTTDTVRDWNAEPPVDEFRQTFAAFWHVLRVLNREATFFQNVAVRFVTLDGRAAKDELFRLYADRIRTRITGLYVRIIGDIGQILDDLFAMGTTHPNIIGWLFSRQDIARMLGQDVNELRNRLLINHQYFSVVLGVFSADVAQRTTNIDQMGTLPNGAGQTMAGRIRRLAMRQYNALAPTDPRKKVADDWLEILRDGDLLRNPPVGSPAAQHNRRLQSRAVNINAGVAAHQLAVANSHPDTPMTRRIVDTPALSNPQPRATSKSCLTMP